MGIAASTTNAAEGHGAGGALVAGWATASGGVGAYASTDHCPGTRSSSGSGGATASQGAGRGLDLGTGDAHFGLAA